MDTLEELLASGKAQRSQIMIIIKSMFILVWLIYLKKSSTVGASDDFFWAFKKQFILCNEHLHYIDHKRSAAVLFCLILGIQNLETKELKHFMLISE